MKTNVCGLTKELSEHFRGDWRKSRTTSFIRASVTSLKHIWGMSAIPDTFCTLVSRKWECRICNLYQNSLSFRKRITSFHKTPLNNPLKHRITQAAIIGLFLRGSSFESWSVHRLPWLRFSVGFHTAFSKMPGLWNYLIRGVRQPDVIYTKRDKKIFVRRATSFGLSISNQQAQ
jgi:hypothetical protein